VKFQVDRDLPVPLGLQLQGQIEYAIAYGELTADEQMPTVRDLAAQLEISPVTVSAAYKVLQDKKLLVTRPGLGTFVSSRARGRRHTRRAETHRQLDRLLQVARSEGVDTAELINMIQVRRAAETLPPVRILFVGLFREATAYYSRHIRRVLNDNDVVTPVLMSDEDWPSLAVDHDLVLTFSHVLAEVEGSLPVSRPVEAVRFIPSRDTRNRLALIEPGTHVGVIAYYPEFSVVLKRSVSRYAPHARVTVSTMLDDEDAARKLRNCDVVVFATGATAILPSLPSHISTFEFRHMPSTEDLRETVGPLLAQIRRSRLEQMNPESEEATND